MEENTYNCLTCKHFHSEPSACYCMHKNNYLGLIDKSILPDEVPFNCPLVALDKTKQQEMLNEIESSSFEE